MTRNQSKNKSLHLNKTQLAAIIDSSNYVEGLIRKKNNKRVKTYKDQISMSVLLER